MPQEMSPGKPTTRRYSEAEKERAVRMVRQLRKEIGTDHGTVKRVAEQLGIGVESLRGWVKRAEVDDGVKPGTTSAEAARIRELEQEVRELRRANEILKAGGCRMDPSWLRQPGSERRWWRVVGGQAGAGALRRQSLSRLWVAQTSFHSLSTAARPRRERARIRRLCLIWAKTGSIDAERFL